MTLTGKRHPFHGAFEVGFDDDGRLTRARASSSSPTAAGRSTSRESICDRALFHLDNAYYIPAVRLHRARRQDERRLAHRVPRLRRPAGHGGDRGDPRSHRAPLGAPARGRARAEPLPRHRRDQHHALRPGARRQPHRRAIWQRARSRARDFADAARARSSAFNAHERARQARHRDHAGEVRHLVHGDVPQPGRRAGARLPRRHRAGEPRRHRDGAGPLHEDARRRDARARPARRARPRDEDARPTRCRTPRRPRPRAAPTSTAPRCATRARRCASASRRSPRDAPRRSRRPRRARRSSSRDGCVVATSADVDRRSPRSSSARTSRRSALGDGLLPHAGHRATTSARAAASPSTTSRTAPR